MTGHAGRLWFSDCEIPLSTNMARHVGRQVHNKIDRFTGGVLPGALFEEELLYDTPEMALSILVQAYESIPPIVAGAFIDALEDLTQERLALGGGSTKGHGYFTGSVSG
ncbi:MAG: RAMP superfamily CRISPR-associated protein, partial [Gammaproteobacteria bacterium]